MRTMSSKESSKEWEGGKGSKRRHGNEEAYQSNWDRIFGGIDYGMLDKDVAHSSDTVKKHSDTVGNVE
tara:strand:- start:538 stop:741 length:204 start_codon:yes stop_codon:yes gene_type:complete